MENLHELRFARPDEMDAIMAFIRDQWRRTHILAVDRAYFRYEHAYDERINFVVAIKEKTGMVDGILGFIKNTRAYENSDAWCVMWKVREKNGDPEAIPLLAHNLSRVMGALCGKSRKCLIVDLDNTLWGGVIGDDGVENIQLGKETAVAEAFTSFQEYVKSLKERGVTLAICSKNNLSGAREGLSHPDSILDLKDFAAVKVNWDPKHLNIAAIAHELKLGLDSFVFVDDNPVERALVKAQLPEVAVPGMPDDIAFYKATLDKAAYFEPVVISPDDINRSAYYAGNARREELKAEFESYESFLLSLQMKAEIAAFKPLYIDRITQLTNKTNQFNLTTKRYTHAEIEAVSKDDQHITLYSRLTDKFGDNGLVSALIGRIREDTVDLELWLMSCRVLNRTLEHAMFDALVERCVARGVRTIRGYYYHTAKNDMVAQHYGKLGFKKSTASENGDSVWQLDLAGVSKRLNDFIEVMK